MTAPSDGPSRAELAWDEAASGYDEYFGPRFAPYLGAAVGALAARRGELPAGRVIVPCVGPGRELRPLAHVFSDRQILASDLSSEMVSLARARNRDLSNVSVERADAMQLSTPDVAALLSVFGLQLLPEPVAALRSWLGLLSPGGIAAIVYWPRDAEPSGPFFSMRRLLRSVGVLDGTWESEVLAAAEAAGARVLANLPLVFEIKYEAPRSAWQALTQLGPPRALAMARGRALIDELGEQFVSELPSGPLSHTPEARLLLLARPPAR
ncbi:MAG TPA: class I SAM-dependent methyltransferase [Polyangiaceae bacterium]